MYSSGLIPVTLQGKNERNRGRKRGGGWRKRYYIPEHYGLKVSVPHRLLCLAWASAGHDAFKGCGTFRRWSHAGGRESLKSDLEARYPGSISCPFSDA